MRRKDREIADRAAQAAILDAAAEIRLGLWDGEEVYIVPLNFVRIGGSLFFHSAPHGRKLDILRERPRVCFEATGATRIDPGTGGGNCTTRYESVIGWGSAAFVEADRAKHEALDAINRKFGAGEGPFPAELVARTVVVRIDIGRMTGKANRGKM